LQVQFQLVLCRYRQMCISKLLRTVFVFIIVQAAEYGSGAPNINLCYNNCALGTPFRPIFRTPATRPHPRFCHGQGCNPTPLTPQRKVKKGAPSCPTCECWNCGIIRNFFGKLRSEKDLKTKFKPPLCKTSVLENILGRFVFGNKSPPSPRRFPEKVLLSGKDFEGVPEWKGTQIF
jgi:hypothetical protein